ILNRLAGEKAGVLAHCKDGYKLKQYVGAIPLHSCVLEVLPKIYDGEDGATMEENRRALFWLLSFVGAFDIKESDLLKKSLEKTDFFELMKYVFARKLNDQVRDGVYRDYVAAEGNERYLKGRLDFVKDMRRNYADKSRFYVRYDEYTEDNPMNRTLAAAARGMVSGSGWMSRQLLAQLSAAFCDVGYENGNCLLAQRVAKNRLNERYWPSYEMAKVFLSGKVPLVYSGEDLITYGFLFDMNRLFEAFVGRFLKRHAAKILGERAEVQVQRGCFFGDLPIRPDVIIELKNRTIVLDTKYKMMPGEEESSNADLFQVYTYCMAMKERSDSKEVVGILLYPKHTGEDPGRCKIFMVGKDTNEKNEKSKYHAKICRRLIDLGIKNERDLISSFSKKFSELFREWIGKNGN
ncbi:MAG: hypothetical protein ABC588_07170, partial [Candidatus Methanosuratincola petrocarbonis]